LSLFGLSQDGEALPIPLFGHGAGGFFGLVAGNYGEVTFDEVRSIETVPEPTTLLLVGSGVLVLARRRRR
jgi:hypothetical protein